MAGQDVGRLSPTSALNQNLVTATGSTTARSLAARFADVVNVLDELPQGYDGTTDGASYLAAAQTRAGSTKAIVINTKVRIASAVGTISAPVIFVGNGSLDLQAGGSVTLSGPLDAPLGRVFWSNGGTLTFSAKVPAVYPQWWGAVGDGVTDDTGAFVAACAAAVAAKKPLTLGDSKLYLSSQAASINTDGLAIVGARAASWKLSEIPEDWGMLVDAGGTTIAQRFDAMRTTLNATSAAVIYSKFNGPIFTGKKLAGHGFTVIGYPANASNSGFMQTTPTAYPGWSQAFGEDLHDVSFAYFGANGLWAKGGLEVVRLRNVEVAQCMGVCLKVTQTPGVNSPLEYVEIDGGSYVGGLLGNIVLDGVSKHIKIHDALLNSAGQLGRRADATYGTSFVIATEADIIYPVWMRPCPASQASIIGATNIEIRNNYAEWCNAIVKLAAPADGTPFYQDVEVTGNFLDPLQNTVRHVAAFMYRILGLTTRDNFTKYGPIFWFDATEGPGFRTIRMAEVGDLDNPAVFDSYSPPASIAAPLTLGDTTIRAGWGSPEGVITAAQGSLYVRKDGAAGTGLYVKESGSGNTGWRAIGNTISPVPAGVSAITVTASPFTYTNNDGVQEAVYIDGGTVSAIAKNAVTLFTASPATVWLAPGEAVTVTYTVAPTMAKDLK